MTQDQIVSFTKSTLYPKKQVGTQSKGKSKDKVNQQGEDQKTRNTHGRE